MAKNKAKLKYVTADQQFVTTGTPGNQDSAAQSATLNGLPMNGTSSGSGTPSTFTYPWQGPPAGDYTTAVNFSSGDPNPATDTYTV